MLADLDMEAIWAEAGVSERGASSLRNFIEWIKVFPDHLEVKVVNSPPAITVLFSEVGLRVPENVGVGGGM